MTKLWQVLLLFGFTVTVRTQEGNDCSCIVLLVDDKGQNKLHEETSNVLGSLCTDADYEFCTDFCKNSVAAFNSTLQDPSSPGGDPVGQVMCGFAKREVKGGALKLRVSVCSQDVRETTVESKQKLCCDAKLKYHKC